MDTTRVRTTAHRVIRQWWWNQPPPSIPEDDLVPHRTAATNTKNRSRSSDGPRPGHKRGKCTRKDETITIYPWVWNRLQSYSNQERYYATNVLLQCFLDGSSSSSFSSSSNASGPSSHVISFMRFAFLREWMDYIHPYIHDPTTTTTAGPASIPHLTKWCATLQFVLWHGLLHDAPSVTTTKVEDVDEIKENISHPSNEIVAIFYHVWPWFCETIWKFVNGRSFSTTTTTMSSSYPQHVLVWIQMMQPSLLPPWTVTMALTDVYCYPQ